MYEIILHMMAGERMPLSRRFYNRKSTPVNDNATLNIALLGRKQSVRETEAKRQGNENKRLRRWKQSVREAETKSPHRQMEPVG